jgi:plastocyanin
MDGPHRSLLILIERTHSVTISTFRPRAAMALAVTLILTLAACGGSSASGGGGTATVTDGDVAISADDLVFDLSTINATAGEGFTITLTNNESQPHNVAVYTEEGGEQIVVGEIITGPDATTQIVVPALEAGTYYFRCDVHPEMEGSIVVEAGS